MQNLIQRVNVGDSLTRTAFHRPARLAVVDGDRRLTYAELNAWVNRLAHGLAARSYAADPRVGEVVVVGLPHERWSEAITAVAVAKPGETLDEAGLLAALKQRLDGYKVPEAVIVVDELPRTSTGKIQKNLVRERHADHYGSR